MFGTTSKMVRLQQDAKISMVKSITLIIWDVKLKVAQSAHQKEWNTYESVLGERVTNTWITFQDGKTVFFDENGYADFDK